MFPRIEILGFKIPMYPVLVAFGALCGLLVFLFVYAREERLRPISVVRILLFTALGFVAFYLGAAFFDAYFHSIEDGYLHAAGITWLGGVVVGFPVMAFVLNRFVPVSRGRGLYTLSLLIPAITLGHGIGRVGCFCGGCCYGMPTDSFLGVTFPGHDVAVLPTQLFEAGFEAILFLVMLFSRKKTKAYALDMYLFSYGTFRFLLEFLRGDDRGSTPLGLSPSQVLSLLLILAGVGVVLYRRGVMFVSSRDENLCRYALARHEAEPRYRMAPEASFHMNGQALFEGPLGDFEKTPEEEALGKRQAA